MVDATGSTMSHNGPDREPDPTLSSLVPQRSRGRGVVLLALAAITVIGVWGSYGVLRPSIVMSNSTGAGAMALPTHDQVITMATFDRSGWPRSLQSVTDVPGARVAGAWLFPNDAIDPDPTLDPAAYADGLAYLEAAYHARDFGESSRLPQRLPRNGTSELVVLWSITDCATLDTGPAPQAELRTWLGTTTLQSLDEFLSPGFIVAMQAGADICP